MAIANRFAALLAALGLLGSWPSAARAADAEDFFSSLITDAQRQIDVSVPIVVSGTQGATFTGQIEGAFDPTAGLGNLSDATFRQLQEGFPIASTVAAFTFSYDQNLNVFVRSGEGLGPILGERAKTTGKGKLNVAFATSHITFDVFEGRKLSKLNVPFRGTAPSILSGGGFAQDAFGATAMGFDFGQNLPANAVGSAGGPGFSFDSTAPPPEVQFVDSQVVPDDIYTVNTVLPTARLASDIDANLFAFFVTYGVLDKLDVGIVIPLVDLSLAGRVTVTGLEDLSGAPITNYTNSDEDDSFGFGDIQLRAKYQFYAREETGLAVRVDLWLPTGDEDELRGLGEDAGTILLIGSTRWRWFSPHANVGFFLRGGDQNAARYQLGTDFRAHERLSLSVDFVGANDLEKDGVGDFLASLASGVKINPWRRLVIGVNALWRLNGEGLRDDVVPSLSVEYTFGE